MGEYHADTLDRTFAALAHPARRRMIELLASQDVCVTHLADHFDCSLNVVSKHIRTLEGAGLVTRTKQGRVHQLHLETIPLAEAASFIERYRKRWEHQLNRLGDYLDKVAEQRRKKH